MSFLCCSAIIVVFSAVMVGHTDSQVKYDNIRITLEIDAIIYYL